MRKVILSITLVGFGACSSSDSLVAARQFETESITLVLENVTLVDVRDGSHRAGVNIAVAGDRIAFIEQSQLPALATTTRTLDGTGKWVVPGFVDVHVHDASESYRGDLLAWGVTSIHLMPNVPSEDPVALTLQAETPEAPTPRLQMTEMFAGDFPDNLLPGAYQFKKPTTVDEARRLVRESYGRGYRQIKIIRDDSFAWSGDEYRVSMLPLPIYEALVTEARALDMRVYVHATQRDVARAALGPGLDAFLHGVMDFELDEDDWQSMSTTNTVWAPTINALLCFGDQRVYAKRVLSDERFTALLEPEEKTHWVGLAEAADPVVFPPMAHLVANSETYLTTLERNTRSALESDLPCAVGTDGGPGGISTHIELELLQEAGLTATEILHAATLGGAVAMGRQADLGSVEEGKLADLVVLNADPTDEVRNCREIEWVIKGGTVHHPSQLALSR
jgi:imidazolonepropionase-like amidohydrolase